MYIKTIMSGSKLMTSFTRKKLITETISFLSKLFKTFRTFSTIRIVVNKLSLFQDIFTTAHLSKQRTQHSSFCHRIKFTIYSGQKKLNNAMMILKIQTKMTMTIMNGMNQFVTQLRFCITSSAEFQKKFSAKWFKNLERQHLKKNIKK